MMIQIVASVFTPHLYIYTGVFESLKHLQPLHYIKRKTEEQQNDDKREMADRAGGTSRREARGDDDAEDGDDVQAEENGRTPPDLWGFVYFMIKLLFVVCMVLQAMLWPSIMTILVVVILCLETILKLCIGSPDTFIASLTAYGVFFLRKGTPKPGLYIYTAALLIYTVAFFVLYASQQLREMPYMTTWIHPDYAHNYSFTESKNNEFSGMNVRDASTKKPS